MVSGKRQSVDMAGLDVELKVCKKGRRAVVKDSLIISDLAEADAQPANPNESQNLELLGA